MELNHLIVLSGAIIIISVIAYIVISFRVIKNKRTTPKNQRDLTNLLLLIGVSGIFCAIIARFNYSIDYSTHAIFLIVSSSVLTYAVMNKVYINKITKELNLKVSEYDK